MRDKKSSLNRSFASGSIGLVRLIQELQLTVRLPAVRSEVVAGARRTRIADEIVFERYPPVYAPKTLMGHLKFAMRHEPIDLTVLDAVFRALDGRLVLDWV